MVIIGLYVFLWGKANEGVKEEDKERSRIEKQEDCESNSVDKNSYKIDMEEPLLKGCTDHIDN